MAVMAMLALPEEPGNRRERIASAVMVAVVVVVVALFVFSLLDAYVF